MRPNARQVLDAVPRSIGIVLCVLVAVSAWHVGAEETKDTRRPPARAGWREAPTDKDGRVIALWRDLIENRKQIETVPEVILEPYAILILCREDWPEKGFYLFNNQEKSYYATKDFGRFMKEVEALPDRTKLTRISTCTVPCEKDLPAAKSERLLKTLEKKKLYDPKSGECSGYHLTACYCEGGLRFLEMTDDPAGDAKGDVQASDKPQVEMSVRPGKVVADPTGRGLQKRRP